MQNISNVSVKCMYCGYDVQGRESSTKVYNGVINECRWNCSRCGRLTKQEEEFIKDEG
jgi:hypothetical protein